VNRHGDKPLNNPAMIIQEFGEEIDLIIDDGILPSSKGSTMYMVHNNRLKKIR
jgi:tRNA A37 threonylcarbamoyladenosine synthetase subunit TsaC/SUA5/YrdC